MVVLETPRVQTVAYPAFEFRGPGVDLNYGPNYYAQATATGYFLTAPLHVPAGATLNEVRCMVLSPSGTNAQIQVYQNGGRVCTSALVANNGGPAAEGVAACTVSITRTNFYYVQVSNLTSGTPGLTVEGACFIKYTE